MASMASLASLGSVRPNSESFGLGVQRVSVIKPSSLGSGSLNGHRWSCGLVCKCMLVAEQGNSGAAVALESSFREDDSDLVLKAAPKPVLKARIKPEPLIVTKSTLPFTPLKLGGDSDEEKSEDLEERNKVRESLGEVLEKAEKLEISSDSGVSSKPVPRVGRPVNSAAAAAVKTKTLKSVWKKGNPVANVQRVVKDSPRRSNGSSPVANVQRIFIKGANKTASTIEKEEDPTRVEEDAQTRPPPLKPPQPPLRVQPRLQARPAVAPPPQPIVKKPVVLKDVGAAPRPPATSETDTAPRTRERKPILVDKFAGKKPVVDPLIAQAVLSPPKPGKNPSFSKEKDEQRRKAGSAGGLRRRLVNSSVTRDDEEGSTSSRKGRKWSKASRKAVRLQAAKDAAPVRVEILEVEEDGMLTEELAYHLAIGEGEILGALYAKGIKPDGVQTLDRDMVKMMCKEYDVEVIDAAHVGLEERARKKEILDEEDLDKLEDRPPVLTIMGHVDHGKTTLLDYIRKSKVTASEAGGITQGIGAYKVNVSVDGKLQTCVFLDTPGHEAFGAMRARGARVTDIAIIVVAADDGVRPQTNEAIAHAKAAGVPIVIAINKIDKDGASPERVMQELSTIGLMPEDWGGDVPMVQISALKGENVDDLLETIMLVAELQELKANPQRNAKGAVIEAGLHKSKGPVATLIVQNGTLKKGDVVVCGEAFGKVRALLDDSGAPVDKAGPSTAAQVLGLNKVPIAGDDFEIVDSLDIAREKAEIREESLRSERISAKAGDGRVTLSSLASAVSSRTQAGLDLHQLNIVMKVDVQGSIEAIKQALQMLPQDNVTLKFLLQSTGNVSASDIDLAIAGKAIILGFNVKAPGSVQTYADNKGIEVRLYRVIYELLDDVRKAMEGLLDPVEDQIPIGAAEVRAIFSSGSGRVAGCMVTEGKIVKSCGVRVVRKGKTVYVGVLDSLRRVKELVKEVNAGLECGIGVDDFLDWEVGDVVEAFNSVQKQRTLEEASTSMVAAVEGVGLRL
ncbi:hypothetical protein GIB67_022230 [Kingdonia uniflora]|uniref:Translation initiation factor IF-2, chloroplastic n=1 Tax=Kingdonia uniflora TaxID=39325 RepID=A0A7J7M788_9MAGN|nr:hypothetical protein GIB67_022230 [Kingdonia uniflora]